MAVLRGRTLQGVGPRQAAIYAPTPLKSETLYLGNGARINGNGSKTDVISVLAGLGGGGGFDPANGSPAKKSTFGGISAVHAGPDGSVYFLGDSRLYNIRPDGTLLRLAGGGSGGDGGPATGAVLNQPEDIALTPDGSLYLLELSTGKLRRIGLNGIIETVVTIPGVNNNAKSLEIAPDGTLFILQNGFISRVYRYTTTSGLEVFAGANTADRSDGIPARNALFDQATDIALAPDGGLYISHLAANGNPIVRKIGSDGIVNTVVGPGTTTVLGDGGPAKLAWINNASSLTVAPDGTLYIGQTSSTGNSPRIRRVTTDGIISTYAGGGGSPVSSQTAVIAVGARLQQIQEGLSVGNDGTLYLASDNFSGGGTGVVQQVQNLFHNSLGAEFAVASPTGGELYTFDASGRHLRTLNAYTGATLYQFNYDAGLLKEIVDGDGLVTALQHDGSGKPTAIVAPFGQRTELAVDANGFLSKVTNPANEAYEMVSTPDGLLTSFKDPRGNTSAIAYDALGRLATDTNAVTGSLSLARTETADGHEVAVTSSLNRTTRHTVDNPPNGDRERTHLQPDNTTSSTLEKTDGTVAATAADGTVNTVQQAADPRFAMQAPFARSTSLATRGLTLNASMNRTADLSDPFNPLSLTSLTDTLTLNGRTSTLAYDQATKTFTSTSAANRQSTQLIDNLGRTLRTSVTGIEPVNNSYDAQGRPETVTQGTGADERQVRFEYNAQGYLARVTDPLGRQLSYQYDLAGRVTTQTLPDGRQIGFGYDAKGNLTSLTPPGRPAHGFTYSGIDQTLSYVPPPVPGSGNNLTAYEYDLDKALTKITRPDGLTLNFSYDSAGRPSVLNTPEGNTTYGYDPTTGKLTGIAAPGGEGLTYTYNGALLTQAAWSGTVAGTVGYSYDNDFRLASVSVNGANPFTYGYDSDSLLTSVGNGALGINYTLARNAQNGLLTGTTLGGVTDSYAYNGFAEMTAYLAKHGATDLFRTDFTRDKLGRITRKVETLAGATHTYDYAYDYAYDLAGRLIEVKQDNVVQETYGYDDNSNRTHLKGAEIAHYDAQDRLLDYNGATYTYTANGELSGKQVGANSFTYRYDVLGNLREATLPGGTQLEYVIDGQNRRIGKKRNGVLEQGFLYQSQLRPVAELDGGGNLVSRFIYGPGVNVPDFMIKGGVTYRLIKDHLGSPRLVVNTATNTVAQRMDYDAWGNVLADTNPGFQPFGFAGGDL